MKKYRNGKKILEALLALLKTSKQWTKDTYARDAAGNGVDYSSKTATCFCLLGGVRRIGGSGDDGSEASEAEARAIHRLNKAITAKTKGQFGSITSFNDSPATTFRDVKAVIRTALRIR